MGIGTRTKPIIFPYQTHTNPLFAAQKPGFGGKPRVLETRTEPILNPYFTSTNPLKFNGFTCPSRTLFWIGKFDHATTVAAHLSWGWLATASSMLCVRLRVQLNTQACTIQAVQKTSLGFWSGWQRLRLIICSPNCLLESLDFALTGWIKAAGSL